MRKALRFCQLINYKVWLSLLILCFATSANAQSIAGASQVFDPAYKAYFVDNGSSTAPSAIWSITPGFFAEDSYDGSYFKPRALPGVSGTATITARLSSGVVFTRYVQVETIGGGSSILCGYTTYRAPGGRSVTWTVSPSALVAVVNNGSTFISLVPNGSGTGRATITASYFDPSIGQVTVSRPLSVGSSNNQPAPTVTVLSGSYGKICSSTTYEPGGALRLRANAGPGIYDSVDPLWQVLDASNNVVLEQSGGDFAIADELTAGSYTLTVVSRACSSVSARYSRTITVIACTPRPCEAFCDGCYNGKINCAMSLQVEPNSDVVSIKMESLDGSEKGKPAVTRNTAIGKSGGYLRVYSQDGRIQYAQNISGPHAFDTNTWPNGLYYVVYSTTSKTTRKKLLIQH